MCMTNRNVLRKTKTPNSFGHANKCPSYGQQNPRMARPGIQIFHRKANIEVRNAFDVYTAILDVFLPMLFHTQSTLAFKSVLLKFRCVNHCSIETYSGGALMPLLEFYIPCIYYCDIRFLVLYSTNRFGIMKTEILLNI
ncbi:hypothetical protein CDAR_454501 [Caerostris darwini]|uniref:Uncharacterized protein n=1 Tax=Caerostris darwini TaxID=1538125 RepID=A0AAV4TWA5_9ARAC|nr:hypothetical protein CDAR_454501 [Caerostris darwini]